LATPGPASARVTPDAVQPRHPDVDQADVRPDPPRQLYGLGAVGRLGDHLDIRLVVQQQPQPAADHRLIVSEQNPDRHGAARCGTANRRQIMAGPGPAGWRGLTSRPRAAAPR
jgi:hypothetical protein